MAENNVGEVEKCDGTKSKARPPAQLPALSGRMSPATATMASTKVLPPSRPIRNVRQARALLSRLISGFMSKEIDGDDARTLTYMVVSYVAVVKDGEFEARLKALEAREKQL